MFKKNLTYSGKKIALAKTEGYFALEVSVHLVRTRDISGKT